MDKLLHDPEYLKLRNDTLEKKKKYKNIKLKYKIALIQRKNIYNNVGKNIIFGYDPIVSSEAIENFGVKSVSLEEGFKDADVVIIMNNHKSYQRIDIFTLLESSKADCIFVDCWHLFEPIEMIKINKIKYISVGCKY